MDEDRLYRDAALARFYDLDNGWTDDRSFCLNMARGCASVLDLGCGTGELAIRIAGDYHTAVTAVDPALAMLNLARSKRGAGRVTWVEADARDLDLGRSFDLIVMTGHAFQSLLSERDRAACLTAFARHLAPEGRFIFDSRNPARCEWREWRPALSRREIADPEFGSVAAWNDVAWDSANYIATYETVYLVTSDGHEFRASSQIAFPSLKELKRLIAAAGLTVDTWFGDWTGAPLAADSAEFIPLGRRA
ncbi:class I SAM-dependent methyltransferase [Albidovulum aquaemixtae]|nr:class I SAM-dependent methyltransferase [Defluviimonas aquaemixtae]